MIVCKLIENFKFTSILPNKSYQIQRKIMSISLNLQSSFSSHNLALMTRKSRYPFWTINENFPEFISESVSGRSSSSIHRFFNFSSHRLLFILFFFITKSLLLDENLLYIFKVGRRENLMSLLFIIIFSRHISSTIVGVIFSIKFIHLLIIAVNHSSCNEFYEFLLMHAGSFFAWVFVAVGHIPVCWASSLVQPSFLVFFCWNARWVRLKKQQLI